MNVSEKSTGNVSAEIIVKIVKADYQDGVDKALRSYRQKANIPGFRKGMVPMGMINKMVGKSVLIEEINKLVSEQLYNYIRDKKMGVLGEPLPAEEQKDIDFDTQEDFEFKFDIALAPEINLDLSKKDKIDYDDIIVDSDMIQKQVDAFCNRFGKQDEAEIVNEKDIVKGKFTELNADGTPKDGGIVVETGMVSPNYIKSEEDKKKFIGANKGSKVVFNPAASCGGNDTELASMLHIKKEEAAAVKSDFEVEISSILSFKPAEVNQELFDNAFGKDTVKDEAEFKSRVSAMISDQIAPEADYKFAIDVRKYVETKVGDMVFADEILKRWLKFNDTENKLQSVDEEYKKMLPDLKWQLIKEQIVKDCGIKVEHDDLVEMAKKATKMQFAQYGMANVPDDLLQKYTDDMLKDKKVTSNMADRVIEDKLVAAMKDMVTLNRKNISLEDFYKSIESK